MQATKATTPGGCRPSCFDQSEGRPGHGEEGRLCVGSAPSAPWSSLPLNEIFFRISCLGTESWAQLQSPGPAEGSPALSCAVQSPHSGSTAQGLCPVPCPVHVSVPVCFCLSPPSPASECVEVKRSWRLHEDILSSLLHFVCVAAIFFLPHHRRSVGEMWRERKKKEKSCCCVVSQSEESAWLEIAVTLVETQLVS